MNPKTLVKRKIEDNSDKRTTRSKTSTYTDTHTDTNTDTDTNQNIDITDNDFLDSIKTLSENNLFMNDSIDNIENDDGINSTIEKKFYSYNVNAILGKCVNDELSPIIINDKVAEMNYLEGIITEYRIINMIKKHKCCPGYYEKLKNIFTDIQIEYINNLPDTLMDFVFIYPEIENKSIITPNL